MCLHLQYLIVSLKSYPINGILFHFSIKGNVMWQVPLASHWESDRHYAPSCDVEILCSQWTRRDALVRFSRHSAEWFCESNVGGKFCVTFVKAILLALQSPIKIESRTTKLRQDDSHRKGRSGCSHVMWCRRMYWYGVYRRPSNLQLLVSSFNLMLFPFCTPSWQFSRSMLQWVMEKAARKLSRLRSGKEISWNCSKLWGSIGTFVPFKKT